MTNPSAPEAETQAAQTSPKTATQKSPKANAFQKQKKEKVASVSSQEKAPKPQPEQKKPARKGEEENPQANNVAAQAATDIPDQNAGQKKERAASLVRPANYVPPGRLSLSRAETRNKRLLERPKLEGINKAQLEFDERLSGKNERQRIATICIVDQPSQDDPKATLLGLCIRDHYSIRYETYPTQEAVEDVLPHVLDIALTGAPALSRIVLTTNHPKLNIHERVSGKTKHWLQASQCTVVSRPPTPFDLTSTLARLASRGITGPKETNYHLYTASISDGEKTYASALLWGRNRAFTLSQTYTDKDIFQAEAAIAAWAFRQMPPGSQASIFQAAPTLLRMWDDPSTMPEQVRPEMRDIGRTIRRKDLTFKQDTGEVYTTLNRTVRQMCADLYAGQDIREKLNYITSKGKKQ